MAGNNEKLSIREIQMAEYSIMCRLVKFFDENGIRYFLCGGTLLGAVRHNGFIPWDDDIDISVPRDDYEKLRDIYAGGRIEIEGVDLLMPGDEGSIYPFIKAVDKKYAFVDERFVIGTRGNLWVDIFPLDHYPDDEHLHRKYVKELRFLRAILEANVLSKEFLAEIGFYATLTARAKAACKKMLFIILGGAPGVVKKIDRVAYKMDTKFKASSHVGDGPWTEGLKDYFPLEEVEPLMKHKFEDGEFNIPVNYDKYLTRFYGDYMTIPPESERADHHITAYRVETQI